MSKRGLAAADEETRKRVSSLGRAAMDPANRYRPTHAQAVAAGSNGGKARVRNAKRKASIDELVEITKVTAVILEQKQEDPNDAA